MKRLAMEILVLALALPRWLGVWQGTNLAGSFTTSHYHGKPDHESSTQVIAVHVGSVFEWS